MTHQKSDHHESSYNNRLFRGASTLSAYERAAFRITGVRPKLKLLRGWIYINSNRYSVNQVIQLVKVMEAEEHLRNVG